MNNPMQSSSLLQSPSSGPPIAKKQRGGRTPGSIRARPRAGSTGSGRGRDRGRGPPPLRSGMPPPSSSSSRAAAAAAASAGEVVDDAIARRRAELRRLQEKARGVRGTSSAASSSTASSSAASSGPPMAPPIPSRGPPLAAARKSDIFPNAPKSPSLIPRPTKTSEGTSDGTSDGNGGPPITTTKSMIKSVPVPVVPKLEQLEQPNVKKSNPNLPPETPMGGTIPPTPAVGRKLEFPSGQKPPPFAGSSKPKAAPPPRARSGSPSAGVPAPSDTKIPVSRAKSAPPRRPPGPPPGAPKAAATGAAAATAPPTATFETAASSYSAKSMTKKKIKARRPAPVRPGTLLPTVKTKSPNKDVSASASLSTPPTPTTSNVPPTTTSASTMPPPMASSIAAIGKGILDTSRIPQSQQPPPLVGSETPRGQKVTASGADTPPSSGSSARRQKLQLMREQALMASTLSNTNVTTNVTTTTKPKPPATATPTTTSFYTAGASGGPATAAFAEATAEATASKVAAPPQLPTLSKAAPPSNADSKMHMQMHTLTHTRTHSAANARLEETLQKAEKEKITALSKVRELEEKLSEKTKESIHLAKKAQQQQKAEIERLLALAESDGAAAARAASGLPSYGLPSYGLPSSPSRLASRTGFATGTPSRGAAPMGIGGSLSDPSPQRRARIAMRALKAHPTHARLQQHQPGGDGRSPAVPPNESPEATERRLIRKFREAAKYVSFEFSSDLAVYFVRRPYGIPTNPGLFAHCKPPQEPEDAYARKAHVSDKTTVEVAAITKADRTPLLVFGAAGIRYQINASSKNVPPDFKHVADVDALDRPLGHVTYIDGQANEKEYSLDEVLEEALLVREQYCGTLTSTALALPDPQPQEVQVQQPQKPPPSETKPAETKPPPPQQHQQAPPDDGADSGSSDVLVVFLGMVVSFFFNLVWGIFVGTPVKIAKTTVVLVAATMLVQALHLYLADGYTEWALREATSRGSSAMLASDLAFYSNQHPGLL